MATGFETLVWTIDADSSGEHRVTHSGCCVELWAAPIWSPDGKRIVFAANSAGGTFLVTRTEADCSD